MYSFKPYLQTWAIFWTGEDKRHNSPPVERKPCRAIFCRVTYRRLNPTFKLGFLIVSTEKFHLNKPWINRSIVYVCVSISGLCRLCGADWYYNPRLSLSVVVNVQEPFVSNLRGKARNSDEGCLLQSDFFINGPGWSSAEEQGEVSDEPGWRSAEDLGEARLHTRLKFSGGLGWSSVTDQGEVQRSARLKSAKEHSEVHRWTRVRFSEGLGRSGEVQRWTRVKFSGGVTKKSSKGECLIPSWKQECELLRMYTVQGAFQLCQ